MARQQQLNLNDPRFAPQRVRFAARQGVVAVAGTLLVVALSAQALALAARRQQAAVQTLEAATVPLRAQLLQVAPRGNDTVAVELPQLKALEAGQQRIRQALQAGAAGAREGHAEFLMALARQAPGAVWISGFSVSEDGSSVALEGRMTDPALLTDYLRRLNNEPRFKGRPFEQLTLRAGESAGGTALTEFVLRSGPAASAATP